MTRLNILLLLFFLSSIQLIAQSNFQPGYYINSQGERISGLIKNQDWKNNPERIDFKNNEESASEVITIRDIQEFGINEAVKFIKAYVEVDRSSERTDKISYTKNPQFNREQHLLKILIEGEVNLYSYEEVDLVRFFYQKNGGDIEPLVFKSFRTEDNRISKNEAYKSELWEVLKCPSITLDDIQRLEYREENLVSFFTTYHECIGKDYIHYKQSLQRDLLSINLRPGLRFSSLAINGPSTISRDVDFGSKVELRLGLEVEIFMPIANNRYAILFEPTIHSFKAEKAVDLQTVKVDYTSLEIPLGLRYYFLLSEKGKLMLNASAMFEFPLSSIVDYENSADIDIRSDANIALGIGYKYQDTLSLELRYSFERLLRDINFVSDRGYKAIELILGYAIF